MVEAPSRTQSGVPAMLPAPRRVRVLEGQFVASDRRRVVLEGDVAAARAVADTMQGWWPSEVVEGNARSGDIVLRVSPDAPPPDVESPSPHEGYRLRLDDVARLEARHPAGLSRGVQTLRTLLPSSPRLEIDDAPRFSWRGLLLDCGRHFISVEQILDVLDLMARHRMNRFHWHLTEDQGWRLEVPGWTRLTEVGAWRKTSDGGRYGGFYTHDDVRTVLAAAATHHIDVIPEIEMPGHAQAALAAYPEFSCRGTPLDVQTEWGIFDEVYCVGKDATRDFLQSVLSEVFALFPFEAVHLGGDECPRTRWAECPSCLARVRGEGLPDVGALQSWFLGHMGRFVQEHGKQWIGWDEILDGGLPPGAILQSWQGFDGLVRATAAGHRAIASPMSHVYLDFNYAHLDQRTAYAFDPVPPELTSEAAARVLGGECNLWTERAPPELVSERLLPRMLAIAERLWTGTEGGYNDFARRADARRVDLEAAGWRWGDIDDPGYSKEDRFDWRLPTA